MSGEQKTNKGTFVINITPMAVFGDKNGKAKGVLTLSAEVSRKFIAWGFDLTESLVGKFIYAGQTCPITVTPKHKEKDHPALQFTVNDQTQFRQLKIDGADSLVDGVLGIRKRKVKGYPALECKITPQKLRGGNNEVVCIQVIGVIPSSSEDRATDLMRRLTENNRSFSTIVAEDNILFESLSPWYDMESERGAFKDVSKCIYILWGTDKKDVSQKKLYIGIVGDTKQNNEGKRNLTERLNEHIKTKASITIEKFRFFELKNSSYSNIPELLKTLEMRIIQALSVVIPQKGNKNIMPLIANGKAEMDGMLCSIELINLTYKHHG